MLVEFEFGGEPCSAAQLERVEIDCVRIETLSGGASILLSVHFLRAAEIPVHTFFALTVHG